MTTHEGPPRKNEDEYFVRRDAELMAKMRAELDEQRRKQERSAHHMKCPKCGADLREREIDQIKVDVCSECHGVWFDQGEMELLRHIRSKEGTISGVVTDFLSIFKHPK